MMLPSAEEPKRFSKCKLQVVNTKTNRPVHPQPTSSETYNPYAVIVPSTSVFLLELTVNTCRKKERPPTTLVAILNVRARSRGHASTNQTFFASENFSLSLFIQVHVQYPHIGRRQIQISPPLGRQDQSKDPPQGQQ